MREPLSIFWDSVAGGKVVARGQVVDSDFDREGVALDDALIIETTGNGRPYAVTLPRPGGAILPTSHR